MKLLRCLLIGGVLSAQTPNVPETLRAPAGQVLLLHLRGEGSQIYVCRNTAGVYQWKFKAPDAKLVNADGQAAGRHFAGPTWEAKDGSQVTGKPAASAASPDAQAIPWLLLSATSHSGRGTMENVQSIQRLATKGGVAPPNGCSAANENMETAVPYEADYFFYGAPAGHDR